MKMMPMATGFPVVPALDCGPDGHAALGRFGFKGGKATIRDQSAGAFQGDMGLATALHPDPWGDCTAAQPRAAPPPAGRSRACAMASKWITKALIW